MTWELASFLIVGAVVLAGFAWYERSKPPSQVVALVAALAALAVAGRIAFAAFPNVTPTTDVAIFAGYALGGAPGFAVGALAALVSNFWFGQGPWTPWQMAGWGMCGVLGAVLALGTRNASRLVLAATCGFAGILYGALLNFSLMATYGGDLSWRHFLVLEARAIPFEAAHALGNVTLALVAGPAMVRMLVRFRERFEWARRGGEPARARRQPPAAPSAPPRSSPLGNGGAAVLFFVLAVLAFVPAAAEANAVTRAADWLEAQQRPSGGFAASAERDPGVEMTSWAMLGLAAAGRNPLDVVKGGKSPVDFLRRHLGEVEDAGDVARTILALSAAGADPRDFGGENLVARLLAQRRESGSYQGWPATSAYAVLALRAAGAEDATPKTVAWLRQVQGEEGGWGNEPKQQSTAEITGAVLQVLSPGSKAGDRALAYLRKAKRPNGGFAPGKNLSANAQATSWASQGLLAAGKDPVGFGPGKSSFAYMRGLQADDGHFLQSHSVEGSPVWVTADVLVGLSGHHLPVAAPPREPKPKRSKTSADESSPAIDSASSLPSVDSESGGTGGASPAFEEAFGGGGGGSGSGGTAPKGGKASGGLPDFFSGDGAPEGEKGAGSKAAATEATGEPAAGTGGDSDSGTAGAIVLGLLAGCLLFALGLAGRRGWMRWRYGL